MTRRGPRVPPGRWEEVQALFSDLVELASEERQSRLEEIAQRDPELEAALRALLEAFENTEKVLSPFERLVSLPSFEAAGLAAGETEAEGESDAVTTDPYGLIGRTVSDYQVEALLGGGGMGVLYKARDIRLDRPAALKFLPPGWSFDPSFKERFLREARAAAALDHPSVCTIYEIGESEAGQLFIAMAFYEGETLREKLTRGPLEVEEAIRLAGQAASGLAAAHARGIIHRDIKPANLMVTGEGAAKLLDFGLAKTAEEGLTDSGMRLGTPAYMSPEQTRGEAVDGRTDLWSLGVVLYEMLTGRRPFRGTGNSAVVHAIRHDDPEPPSELREELPPELESLVLRLLAKEPADRYGDAAQLSEDLLGRPHPLTPKGRRPPGQPSRKRRPILTATLAIAVLGAVAGTYLTVRARTAGPPTLIALDALPEDARLVLADFEGAPEDSSLARTVTEALRIDLSQSATVKLAEPTRVRQVLRQMERPENVPLDLAAATELAVRAGMPAVIGGGIRRVGDRFVLTAQVVSAEEGRVLVSRRETAESEQEVIPAIDRLSRGLRERIGESLTTIRASPPLEAVTTSSIEALRKYDEGRRARLFLGEELRSQELLEEAVALDSNFAMGWRELGMAYGGRHPSRSLEALAKAFALRDRMTDRERYLTEGSYYGTMLGDRLKSINAYRTLLESYPDDPLGHHNLAAGYFQIRDYAAAERHFALNAPLDPFIYPIVLNSRSNLVRAQVAQGKIEEARATLDLYDGETDGPNELIEAYFAAMEGDYQTAESWGRLVWDENPGMIRPRVYAAQMLSDLYLVRGRLAEAEHILNAQVDAYDQASLPHRVFQWFLTRGAFGRPLIQAWFREDPEGAIIEMEQALDRFPIDSMAVLDRPYGLLASFYALVARPEKAREWAALAEATFPLHPWRRTQTETHDLWGDLAFAEGRYADAVAAYRLADQSTGDQVRVLGRLGRAYEAAGQRDSAIAVYERYVTTPQLRRLWSDAQWLGYTLERLGALYDERGVWEKAVEHYGKFVELWGEADSELQPRVRAAQQRLEVILAERT